MVSSCFNQFIKSTVYNFDFDFYRLPLYQYFLYTLELYDEPQ